MAQPLPSELPPQTRSQHGGPCRSSTPSIYTLLVKVQAGWAGHVTRMPKQLIHLELERTQLPQSVPHELDINTNTWETAGLNRSDWHGLITTGARKEEDKRCTEAERKQAAMMVQATLTSSPVQHPPTWVPHAGEPFRPGLDSPATSRSTVTDQQLNGGAMVIFSTEGRTTTYTI